MTTRTIEDIKQAEHVCGLIKAMAFPCTVTVLKGKHRSTEQNRLQRLWISEATEQLQDESAEDKRAHCKLYIGVPILRNDSEEFKEVYDRLIRPHTTEEKLEMMKVPLDFPVTRLMTTGQKTEYLKGIEQHFLSQGVILTEPESER